MSSGFGPAYQLPVINPHDVMNETYMQQVEAHAVRNPHDQHAQALYAHWSQAMAQIRSARAAAAAAAQAQQGLGALSGNPGAGPVIQPMPSVIPGVPGAAPVPTPPMSGSGHVGDAQSHQ